MENSKFFSKKKKNIKLKRTNENNMLRKKGNMEKQIEKQNHVKKKQRQRQRQSQRQFKRM